MRSRFTPASLRIDVDTDVAGDLRMLRVPAKYEPAVSRIVMHETLHLWQLSARPFLERMLAEDLERLRKWEQTGQIDPVGPLRREFARVDPHVGFSAEQLHEAVARFWDVHIIGAPLLLALDHADPARSWDPAVEARYLDARDAGRLTRADGSYTDAAFDLAMAAAAGPYATPYRKLLANVLPFQAVVVFPLAGALAFSSARPVIAFAKLVEMIVPLVEPVGNIHRMWPATFPGGIRAAHQLATEHGDDTGPFAGLRFDGDDILEDWLPYRALRSSRNHVIEQLAARPDIANRSERPADLEAIGELGGILIFPGDPDNRGALINGIPPPVVHLGDRRWLPGVDLAREAHADADLPPFHDLADELDSCHERWTSFVQAAARAMRPPRPVEVLQPEACALASAIDALTRLTEARDTRLVRWLGELVDGDLAGGDFEAFMRRHLVGTIRTVDAETSLDEILFQIAQRRGLETFDSERGVTRRWHGWPPELTLAAALVERAAELVDLDDLRRRAALVVTESMRVLDAAVGSELPEPIRAALLARIAAADHAAEVETWMTGRLAALSPRPPE